MRRLSSLSDMSVAVLGFVVSAVFIAVQIYLHRDAVLEGTPFVTSFAGADQAIDVILGRGDGQAYVQLARDPLLNDTDAWGPAGASELRYRAQRPLAIYATWALSMGNSEWADEATVVLSALGCGLLAWASAGLLRQRGIPAWVGAGTIFIPGVFTSFRFFMPGALALGLGIAGLTLWNTGRHRRWLAVGCFCLAVLTRETIVMFPLAIALFDLANRRRPDLRLLLPPAVYVGWGILISTFVSNSPVESVQSRVAWPLAGAAEASASWAWTEDWLVLAITLALSGLAIARRRDDVLTWVIISGLGLAMVMGDDVWGDWVNWTRALAPIHFALAVQILQPDPDPGTSPKPIT